uniref:NACHT, LRR and PYD domains-containing protein 3-like n=3 Tax=Denticeps clupeoides TaxID=299321 RepID=A0AAY4ART2_9TELE
MDSLRSGVQFVDKHRAELIQRVSLVMPLADVLLSRSMLRGEMYSEIRAARTSQEKMRELFRALHSGGEQAKFAFYSALRDHDPHLLQDLERDTDLGHSSGAPERKPLLGQASLTEYREAVHSKYKTVLEYNSLPGEHVLLADRYTDLLIVQKYREEKDREEEIRSKGQKFQQVLNNRAGEMYHSVKISDFFREAPKSVILQGHTGHGKSFTVQKMMCDWASGELFQEFDFVFHLNCKELNHYLGAKNLVDLLSCSQRFTPLITQVLQQSPHKVLLVIDGFDELKFTLEGTRTPLPTDPFTQAPVEDTLRALLRGHILPESFLLITTRSTASDRLSKLLKSPQCFTEILGFTEQRVKEYFQRFFNNVHLFEKAFKFVQANETLFTACFVPVICWIVCTVFREQFKKNVDMLQGLETATSIFVHFVFTLLEHHCQGLCQPVPTLLLNLGQLAERGMVQQQVLFDERTVFEVVSDPTTVPFLCKFLLKKKISLQPMFSFMHLSFQEFFTALLYTLIDKKDPQKIQTLLYPHGEQHLKSPHLIPVIQFLFGLSNKDVTHSLMEIMDISTASIRKQLEEWILSFIQICKSQQSDNMEMFIFHCLYELHEEYFVKRAMEDWDWIELFDIPLKRTDCWVLLYCLQCCPSIRKLKVTHCNLTGEKLRMLQPALCRCEELGLHVKDLTDDDVEVLISALGERKVLSELRVTKSSLSEESMHQLLEGLSKQKSLGSVLISVKAITCNTTNIFLQFFQEVAIKELCCVEVGDLSDANKESLCSSLSATKNIDSFRLTAEHSCPGRQPKSSSISLTVSCNSEILHTNCIGLLHTFHSLNCLKINSRGFEQHVDTLLSFLHVIPGLKRVELEVNCLIFSWVSGILSLIQACPCLEEGSVQVFDITDGEGESLYSFLSVGQDTDTFRLTAEHSCIATEAAHSHLSLTLSRSSEFSKTDWISFLQEFHTLRGLTENSPGFDEHVDGLLTFLRSVPYLRKVELEINCLTESWADRILSLTRGCPTIEEIKLAAGRQYIRNGLLLEKGLQKLQSSQRRPNCTLLLQGRKCSKITDKCTDYKHWRRSCNRYVEIEVNGEYFTEKEKSLIYVI